MRRIVTTSFWRYEGWKLAGALLAASVFVVAGVGLRAHDTHQLDEHICARVDVLDAALVGLLLRSQKSLPSNPFYKQHQELLASALRENRRTLRDFKNASC